VNNFTSETVCGQGQGMLDGNLKKEAQGWRKNHLIQQVIHGGCNGTSK
jgi:hypothetical protein